MVEELADELCVGCMVELII